MSVTGSSVVTFVFFWELGLLFSSALYTYLFFSHALTPGCVCKFCLSYCAFIGLLAQHASRFNS